MDRRTFIKSAALGTIILGISTDLMAGEKYFPSKVDQRLFETINAVKDPANKLPLEKSHAPVITAPEKVHSGEPFTVEVSIGEVTHAMGPAHWIEYMELSIGNEPAGRIDFQPRGFLQPKAVFHLVLTKEAAPAGKATLMVHQRCNLHGYWEGSRDVVIL